MGETIAQNRRARHEYSIEDTFEAGIVLRGTEAEARQFHEARRAKQPWIEEWDGYANGNLIGTAEQVSERIAAYRDMGVSYVVPWMVDYPGTETLERLAREVAPNFT